MGGCIDTQTTFPNLNEEFCIQQLCRTAVSIATGYRRQFRRPLSQIVWWKLHNQRNYASNRESFLEWNEFCAVLITAALNQMGWVPIKNQLLLWGHYPALWEVVLN